LWLTIVIIGTIHFTNDSENTNMRDSRTGDNLYANKVNQPGKDF